MKGYERKTRRNAAGGLAGLIGLWLTAGCSLELGWAPGNEPGTGATRMEWGSIATDPRTDRAYVLRTESNAEYKVTNQRIWSAHPDRSEMECLGNFGDRDRFTGFSMHFPRDSILLDAHSPNWVEHLLLFDLNHGFAGASTLSGSLRSLATSATGAQLAVIEDGRSGSNLFWIDASSLEPTPIMDGDHRMQLAWLHHRDTLLAVVPDCDRGDCERLRLQGWTFSRASEGARFQVERTQDIPLLAEMRIDWVRTEAMTVSLDDRTAVVPLAWLEEGADHFNRDLAVVDLTSGAVHLCSSARGPVALTPDGSKLVAWRAPESGSEEQRTAGLIVETTTCTTFVIPMSGPPRFTITDSGRYTVISPVREPSPAVIVDMRNLAETVVPSPGAQLDQFVTRSQTEELWFTVDEPGFLMTRNQDLVRLDLHTGERTPMDLSGSPSNIGLLPERDLLVIDGLADGALRFFDPVGRVVVSRTNPPAP